ncbi:MAG: 4-alpha-glucanotransferase [Deltaproteobacteria bacterium]|nr:4-alpha-glucanotransferase [Deltaproteobacteria bacterium]
MTMKKSERNKGIDAWGVYEGYRDSHFRWQKTDPKARDAIHSAMDIPFKGAIEEAERPVRVIKAGRGYGIRGHGEIVLEDGTTLKIKDRLPSDLPVGYHHLYLSHRGKPQLIIVAPSEGCYLPDGLNAWGWSVQLYALRSSRSWGIGDLGDLERCAKWSVAKTKADLLLINPLCAATPGLPQQPSPYYPTSRLFRNPLYLNIEAVPGAAEDHKSIEKLAAKARQMNDKRHIDRDAVFKLKMTALDRLWKTFRPTRAFEHYCADQGDALEKFAIFCALSEQYGSNWHDWPKRFRRSDGGAVKRFAEESIQRMRFHQWLQWLIDGQLGLVGKSTLLITDLPIGFDPGGADAWRWQDMMAEGVRMGAPPDKFNALGQDWGVEPFVPWKLRKAGYGPFIESLKAAMTHAGGLRIDHVMALFRLFWIPEGMAPQRGTYVAYPVEEMLAVLAVESQRHKAVIIGEDLGTVAAGVRRRLAFRRILGCALFWFEKKLPSVYRTQTMASITTHDLPTLAGLWSGQDVRIQRKLGLNPPEEDYRRICRRVSKLAEVPGDVQAADVIPKLHKALAQGSSMVAVAMIDDALGVLKRPNMPGTTTSYPNWSLALPVMLDDVPKHPLVCSVAAAMDEGRRSRKKNIDQMD